MNRSDPISVISGKNCERCNNCDLKEMETESLEDYTYVTSHGPDKSSTKVYYDNGKKGHDRIGVVSMDRESPARFVDEAALGEKAFCSMECRSRQIMIDERKEQCRSKVSRSADVSSSSYTRSPIFSTGILAI
ncbi:hypothetical protein GH714_027946 [Hevea brasiliensis]|uniref:FLZ-type domain-containing protein n=1 Tax=Hevea brasiliensis TaxID=3981 RepID=A0A6A6LWU7_HEVBR|nr:hypothetical protein GH714_027946 [Hevea brasiliensis]